MREGEKKDRMSFWWHSRFGLPWGTQGQERRGAHQSAKDKGRDSVSVLIFIICVWPVPTVLRGVPPTIAVPFERCSQCHSCQSTWLRGPVLSTRVPVWSKQWQGRLYHHEMHSWQIILLIYHQICSYAGEMVLNYLVGLVEEQLDSLTHRERLSINIIFTVLWVCLSVWKWVAEQIQHVGCILLYIYFFFFKGHVFGSSSLLSQVAVSC